MATSTTFALLLSLYSYHPTDGEPYNYTNFTPEVGIERFLGYNQSLVGSVLEDSWGNPAQYVAYNQVWGRSKYLPKLGYATGIMHKKIPMLDQENKPLYFNYKYIPFIFPVVKTDYVVLSVIPGIKYKDFVIDQAYHFQIRIPF